jgi:gamma-glutamylputrescine oxidase
LSAALSRRPVWEGALTPPPPPARLPESPLDVAVVGGGLAGLSTAYHLLALDPRQRVAVIEAERIGAGASGRNTGMVGPGVGQSLESLVARVGAEAARALYQATLEAVRTTVALIDREGLECDLQRTAQIVVARSWAERRRLRRQAQWMARLGLPHHTLDDAGLHARIRLPSAAGGPDAGPAALVLPEAALVDPAKLVAGLAARVVARGGVLAEGCRVVRIEAGRTGEPARIDLAPAPGTEATRILARKVVVATAGYTPGLGRLRGRVLPVHLQALATAPLPPAAREHLGWAGREGIIEARRLFSYFRLTADDRLVFGGGAPRYPWGGRRDPRAEEHVLRRLEGELRRRFASVPGLRDLPVTHAWTGVIGYVLDALPSIGASREEPQVLQLLGWCGHGLALSVAAGSWVAALSAGQPRGELPWFRDRPPLLPGEGLRWLAFRGAVAGMALADRLP